jgi:hypothetical protein
MKMIRNAYKISTGKSKEESWLRRPRCKWNIKKYCGVVSWINLA